MLLHILSVAGGAAMVGAVLLSALQTVVLPKGGLTAITRFVFASADRLFIRRRGLPARFGWEGLYAPVSLVMLPLAWAILVTVGFGLVFWGFDYGTLTDSMAVSGSSLFTLGFVKPEGGGLIALTFLEALIGLGLVALLISFLPTLYSAYSEREKGVGLLRPLMGVPPSAIELIRRTKSARALTSVSVWGPVSAWFASLEQSHTAFPSLCSFPAQVEDHSWVVSAGVVLDSAALLVSCLPEGDIDHVPEFMMVLAHGTSAISRVAAAAGLPVEQARPLADVVAQDASEVDIAVSRAEFDDAVAAMRESDVELRTDLDAAWNMFRLIRDSYEDAVLGLAGLTHAPPAPWTSDRSFTVGRPHFFGSRPLTIVRTPGSPSTPGP